MTLFARIAISAATSLMGGGGDSKPGPPRFGMRFKGGSFDGLLIKSKAEKAERKYLFRAGGYVRKVARNSVRKRKRPSSPGNAPSSPTRVLKSSIAFGVGPNVVAIGPTLLGSKPAAGIQNVNLPTATLEYGGPLIVREYFVNGHWQRRPPKYGARGVRSRKRTVQVAARPFMGPALDVSLSAVSEFWRDVFK